MNRLAIAGLLMAVAITGCSHSSPGFIPMTPNTPMDSVRATITSTSANVAIKVPSSASAQSASVSINNSTPVVQNLTSSSAGCVAATATTPLTCTVPLTVTSGTDSVSIKSYSAAGATGSLLSSATFPHSFSATSTTTVPVILGGTPSGISLALRNAAPRECGPRVSIPLYVTATDAGGNIIVGPYGSTVSLSDSDTSGDTQLSVSSIGNSSTAVTVAYNGYPIAGAELRAAASTVASTNVHPATLAPLQMIYEAANPISIYPSTDNGSVTPIAQIHMPSTVQYPPAAVALSKSCMLYELDATNVLAWPADSAPYATPSINITGTATRLGVQSKSLTLDSAGYLYVTNIGYTAGQFTPEIDVFAPGTNGDTAPVRVISGSSTGLAEPAGIAVDSAGNIYVGDSMNAEIFVFSSTANGNVAPIRTLAGTNVPVNGPGSMAVDASGKLYVANYSSNEIDVFAAGANGNVAPIQRLSVASPNGISLSEHNTMVVSSPTIPGIVTFPLTASGTASPLRTIRYDTPSGVAI